MAGDTEHPWHVGPIKHRPSDRRQRGQRRRTAAASSTLAEPEHESVKPPRLHPRKSRSSGALTTVHNGTCQKPSGPFPSP